MRARRTTVHYGPHRAQVAELWRPVGSGSGGVEGLHGAAVPVVVLFHGGYWRAQYTKVLMHRLAADVARRGWAAWNVDYRRVGFMGGGGGWPATLLDAAAAVDRLAEVDGIDHERVALCGHSAGGQLALWCAGRHRIAPGMPGALASAESDHHPVGRPRIRVAIAMAGAVDLVEGANRQLGGGAVRAYLGGSPDEVPERYATASPAALLPMGVTQVLIHGTADLTVPPSMSQHYAERAVALGDPVVCDLVKGADHRSMIDPASPAWARAMAHLETALA